MILIKAPGPRSAIPSHNDSPHSHFATFEFFPHCIVRLIPSPLLHKNQLVRLHIFQRIHMSARPSNFQNVNLLGLSQSKMNPQIIL